MLLSIQKALNKNNQFGFGRKYRGNLIVVTWLQFNCITSMRKFSYQIAKMWGVSMNLEYLNSQLVQINKQ